MKFISPAQFPLWGIALIIVTMGLLGWFVIKPLQASILEGMNDIQKFHADRENRQRQFDKLPELRSQFEAIQRDEKTLNILLSEEEIVNFVKTLEDLARGTNTQIVIQAKDEAGGAIQEKKPVKAPRPGDKAGAEEEGKGKEKAEKGILEILPYDRYLYLNIVVTGKYSDLVNFLHKMETLPYALDVVSLRVHPVDPEEEKNEVPDVRTNPFMLSPSGGSVLTPTEPIRPPATTVALPKNALEGSFETVVYLKKTKE